MKKYVSGETPRMVIVLDRVFNGNDQEKANLSIQLRDAELISRLFNEIRNAPF
jgi:hypothetical protein